MSFVDELRAAMIAADPAIRPVEIHLSVIGAERLLNAVRSPLMFEDPRQREYPRTFDGVPVFRELNQPELIRIVWQVRIVNIDFSTLPAGAQMDRFIAEKVMGWTLTKDTTGCLRNQERTLLSGWNPSGNIADAWEVVEKIGEMGVTWTTSKGRHIAVAHIWLGGERIEVIADTAPLAICRAALRARQ